MFKLLKDPLICKYFASVMCVSGITPEACNHTVCVCYAIVGAMHEDIHMDDKYLFVESWIFKEAESGLDVISSFHPHRIRIPDKFQHRHVFKCECGVWQITFNQEGQRG